MIWNYPDTGVPKPCDECTIIAQVAGLEYPNGKNANIDTGLWLHHMVHFTTGPGRWDPTCVGKSSSMPHAAIGSSPTKSERYFSSGNERTLLPLDIFGKATDAGYHLRSSDKFAFIVDLMNMNMEDVVVYMTMSYDYVDGPLPAGWRDIKTVWFDANQCGSSEVNPPQQNGKFVIDSGRWVPNFDGEIIGVAGHLHDGGTAVKVNYGPGKTLCESSSKYGESSEFISPAKYSGAHSHGGASSHISSMSTCIKSIRSGLPISKLDASQVWTIDGYYNYDAHAGDKHGDTGKQDTVMSIALMYVAVAPGGVTNNGKGSFTGNAKTAAPLPISAILGALGGGGAKSSNSGKSSSSGKSTNRAKNSSSGKASRGSS
jgi:hypothetical protein